MNQGAVGRMPTMGESPSGPRWQRSMKALERSDPNLVQLMSPIVTSGFVCNKDDVFDALKNGAVAVSTSDSELWNLDTER